MRLWEHPTILSGSAVFDPIGKEGETMPGFNGRDVVQYVLLAVSLVTLALGLTWLITAYEGPW